MTERGHAPKPIDAKPTGATLMQRGKRVQQQRRMYSGTGGRTQYSERQDQDAGQKALHSFNIDGKSLLDKLW